MTDMLKEIIKNNDIIPAGDDAGPKPTRNDDVDPKGGNPNVTLKEKKLLKLE